MSTLGIVLNSLLALFCAGYLLARWHIRRQMQQRRDDAPTDRRNG